MEEPTQEDVATLIMEVKDDSTPPQSQRKNPRRKLVQSTLFPHKPQITEISTPLSQETHQDQEEKGDCSSPNGKRKRRGKGGGSTKKTTPKKKVPDSGKEATAAVTPEDKCSPLAAGKRNNRRAKEKLQGEASPCKVLTPSRSKGKCRRQIMTNSPLDAAEGQTQHAEVPVIDLRLEAKLAAEENAKLFAGKQTHPFFSARKLDKRSQETVLATESEIKSCLVVPEDLHPPIHVFERTQAQEDVTLNWRSWLFCDEALISSNHSPETTSSSVFEGSVRPLSFNDFLMISNSVETSSLKKDMSLKRCCHQVHMNSMYPINSSTSADLKAQERNEVDLSVECTDSINNSSDEHHDRLSQERMSSYICPGSQPDTSLWATKYQPQKASEVCGNGDSVKFLSEWLQYWREKRPQTNKNSALGDKVITLDSDCSSDENYSDAESVDEEGLKNVLLVTGPVGSGKSAAIYACAKEQGFEVIEVSASDWRNGAHVKQKFGEAMESHRFSKWSSEDSAGPRTKKILTFSSVQNGNSSATLNTGVEVISETCLEEPEIVEVERENLNICNRVTNKTLILFEDVDTIFDEDRGLISTIQQLAETAKRPMILTCNSQDPVLPYQLNRLEVRFAVPSSKELLTCLRKICMAENADIPTLLLERFLGCCQGDIRKTIMLLQFWCQGIRNKKEREPQLSYPLQVDLDAWHWVLPKVVPWGFPCQLSELVDKEITELFGTSKQSASLLDIVEEEELSHETMQDAYEIGHYNEADTIVAKKQAMLSMNGSLNEANGFSSQFNGVAEFSNSSGSPVAFTRRNAKKRQSTVFSSLSGDECTEHIPADSHISPSCLDSEMPEGNFYGYLADTVPVQTSIDVCTIQQHCFNRELPDLNLFGFGYSETESQQICDTFKSVDVSCVPESSYVPETEINGVGFQSNTICCGEASVSFGAVSLSGAQSFPCLSMDANKLDEVIPDRDKSSDAVITITNDTDAEAAHEDEKTGDTHIEHEKSPIRGYQVMDECSRADFNRTSTYPEDDRCLGEINPVEEAWQKLRCREDLKLHVTSQMKEASQFQSLISRMTNLISEADLMLGCCQPLSSDFDEMPIVPPVEPNTMYLSDEQLEMISTVVQHGLGYFAKESVKTGPNLGLKKMVDLEWEMFAFTTNTTELGKVLTQDLTANQISCVGRGLENGSARSVVSSKSEAEEHLNKTIQGLVPPRLSLAMRGSAFSDYASSLSQISKFEASRLSDNIDKQKSRRRGRVARHYLTAGPLTLSPEDVSLLAQQNCYGKVSGE